MLFVVIFALCMTFSHTQYICNNKIHPDIVMDLPPLLECNSTKFVETMVSVKKVNDIDYVTDAVVVSAKSYKCKTPPGIVFWSASSENIEYISLSKDDIMKMNETLTYGGKKLEYIESSFKYVLNSPVFNCVRYFLTSSTFNNTYITLQRIKMHYKNHFIHTDLGSVSCDYVDGICKIYDDVYILWNVDEKAIPDYNVYRNKKAWLLYDVNKNTHVLFNDEHGNNVSVIIDNLKDVDDDGFITTSNFAYKIKFNKPIKETDGEIITHHVSKRSLDSDDETDTLQYLYDLSSFNSNVIKEMCKDIALSIMETFSLCSISAHECISSLIGERNINVKVVGTKYLIYKCNQVKINSFLPSYKDGKCSVFPKVSISLQGKQLEGYYNIRTEQVYSLTKYTSQCDNVLLQCIGDENNICTYNHHTGLVNTVYNSRKINLNSQYINKDVLSYDHDDHFNISRFDSVPLLSDVADYINTNMHVSSNVVQYNISSHQIATIVLITSFACIFLGIGIIYSYVVFIRGKNKNSFKNLVV